MVPPSNAAMNARWRWAATLLVGCCGGLRTRAARGHRHGATSAFIRRSRGYLLAPDGVGTCPGRGGRASSSGPCSNPPARRAALLTAVARGGDSSYGNGYDDGGYYDGYRDDDGRGDDNGRGGHRDGRPGGGDDAYDDGDWRYDSPSSYGKGGGDRYYEEDYGRGSGGGGGGSGYYDDEGRYREDHGGGDDDDDDGRRRRPTRPKLPAAFNQSNRKLGTICLSSGAAFTLLGITLFFNKTLMRLGNLLFVAGVPLMIGPGRTVGYFLQPAKARATGCLGCGILLVLVGHPLIGIILEVFGLLNLFGNMFPLLRMMGRNLPVVGGLFGVGGGRRRESRYDDDGYRREDEGYEREYYRRDEGYERY